MVTLISIISKIESNDNPWAIRFEEVKYADLMSRPISTLRPEIGMALKTIRDINQCDYMTALQIYCTSWGKFQFLGETLYSSPINFQHPVGMFWSSEIIQGTMFQEFVRAKNINIDMTLTDQNLISEFRRFAVVWNGPGNVTQYTEKMWITYSMMNTQGVKNA